jgi:hypothetical protein
MFWDAGSNWRTIRATKKAFYIHRKVWEISEYELHKDDPN